MSESLDDHSHDQTELERLHRFCTRPGLSFGLALVRFRDFEVAARARTQASERLAVQGLSLASIQLGRHDDERGLIDELANASESAEIIWLTGLHTLLRHDGDQPRHTKTLTQLNYGRDELPRRVRARVVLWLDEHTYPELARQAWDLVSVMLTQFELRERLPRPPNTNHTTGFSRVRTQTFVAPELDPAVQRGQAERLIQVARRPDATTDARIDALESAAKALSLAGDQDRARELYLEALDSCPDDDITKRAGITLSLGLVELDQGAVDTAVSHIVESMSAQGETETSAIQVAALLLAAHGRPEEGLRLLVEDALPSLNIRENPTQLVLTSLSAMEIEAGLGHMVKAHQRLDALDPIVAQIDDTAIEARLLAARAKLLELEAHLDDALLLRRRALRLGLASMNHEVNLLDMAEVLVQLGRPDEAEAMLVDRLSEFRLLGHIARSKLASPAKREAGTSE